MFFLSPSSAAVYDRTSVPTLLGSISVSAVQISSSCHTEMHLHVENESAEKCKTK